MRLIISDNMIFLQQISDEIVLSDSIIANHGLVLTKSVGGNLNMAFSQFDNRWDLSGLHKLCYPTIRDRSTWSKFGAHGEHGDVFLFSNLGAL